MLRQPFASRSPGGFPNCWLMRLEKETKVDLLIDFARGCLYYVRTLAVREKCKVN